MVLGQDRILKVAVIRPDREADSVAAIHLDREADLV